MFQNLPMKLQFSMSLRLRPELTGSSQVVLPPPPLPLACSPPSFRLFLGIPDPYSVFPPLLKLDMWRGLEWGGILFPKLEADSGQAFSPRRFCYGDSSGVHFTAVPPPPLHPPWGSFTDLHTTASEISCREIPCKCGNRLKLLPIEFHSGPQSASSSSSKSPFKCSSPFMRPTAFLRLGGPWLSVF